MQTGLEVEHVLHFWRILQNYAGKPSAKFLLRISNRLRSLHFNWRFEVLLNHLYFVHHLLGGA